MHNRTLPVAIGLCLLAAGAGKLLAHTPASTDTGNLLLTWGIGLGQLLGLLLLVQNGTILRTGYAKIILPLSGLLLVGVAFKILHWLGADLMLRGALAGIALAYTIRFIRKRSKGQLDILKLLLVVAACGCTLLIFLHVVPREAAYVAPTLLWLTVLDYLYLESRKRAVS